MIKIVLLTALTFGFLTQTLAQNSITGGTPAAVLPSVQQIERDCPPSLANGQLINSPNAGKPTSVDSLGIKALEQRVKAAFSCPSVQVVLQQAKDIQVGPQTNKNLFAMSVLNAWRSADVTIIEKALRIKSVHLVSLDRQGKLGYEREKMRQACYFAAAWSDEPKYTPEQAFVKQMLRPDAEVISYASKLVLRNAGVHNIDAVTPSCTVAIKHFFEDAQR